MDSKIDGLTNYTDITALGSPTMHAMHLASTYPEPPFRGEGACMSGYHTLLYKIEGLGMRLAMHYTSLVMSTLFVHATSCTLTFKLA